MRRRGFVLRKALFALALLFGALSCHGVGFPITLVGETAYTLPQGQWLIGSLVVPGLWTDPAAIEVRYGLLEELELGTKPLLLLGGFVNSEVKYLLSFAGGTALAAELGVGIPSDLSYFGLWLGARYSLPVGITVWHLGGVVWISPGASFRAHAAVEIPLFPWMSLLAEMAGPPLEACTGAVFSLADLVLGRAVIRAELADGLSYESYIEFFVAFGP